MLWTFASPSAWDVFQGLFARASPNWGGGEPQQSCLWVCIGSVNYMPSVIHTTIGEVITKEIQDHEF